MRNFLGTVVAAMVLASLSFAAWAQSQAEKAIDYRQGVMTAQAWHMGNMARQLRGEKPYEQEDFARSATFVSQLAPMAWDGFAPGTDKGAPTKAKAAIWTDAGKFKAAQEQFVKASAALAQAAAGGNLDSIKPAFGALGKSCKGCHDDFQSK